MKRALRVSLGCVVLLATFGWPFIWRPLKPDDEFFGRAAVELSLLWLAWWLFLGGSGPSKNTGTQGGEE